jgi:hypothetical protein
VQTCSCEQILNRCSMERKSLPCSSKRPSASPPNRSWPLTFLDLLHRETYLESRIQIKALRHSNVIPIEQVDQEVLQNVDKSLLKHGNKKRKRGEEEDEVVANQKRTVSRAKAFGEKCQVQQD